jgi:hypothetical protein
MDPSGKLTLEVTDGGGPTRPVPATPSVTAHGGRGLNIITALAKDWGVRDDAHGEVTVWVVVQDDVNAAHRADDFATRVMSPSPSSSSSSSSSSSPSPSPASSGSSVSAVRRQPLRPSTAIPGLD